VTLPVSTPSTRTFAPSGNEVTCSDCARRLAGILKRQTVAATTANQRILWGWVMVVLLKSLATPGLRSLTNSQIAALASVTQQRPYRTFIEIPVAWGRSNCDRFVRHLELTKGSAVLISFQCLINSGNRTSGIVPKPHARLIGSLALHLRPVG
jgi:hypothetical protein